MQFFLKFKFAYLNLYLYLYYAVLDPSLEKRERELKRIDR